MAKTDTKIEVREHVDAEKALNRLGRAVCAIEEMTTDERIAAFNYLKSRYAAEWPYSG